MASLRTVYGRGETLRVGDEDVEIIMMKNPPSLQLNLDYLERAARAGVRRRRRGHARPVLGLRHRPLVDSTHVDVVSGTKAWQFATRFALRGHPGATGRCPSCSPRSQAFLALPKPSRGTKTMIVNYEQMMLIRKQLGFLDLEGGDR